MGAAGIAGVRRGVLPWARRGSRAYAVASCHGRRGDRTRTPWRLAMGAVGTAHVRRGVLPWAPRGPTARVRRGALPWAPGGPHTYAVAPCHERGGSLAARGALGNGRRAFPGTREKTEGLTPRHPSRSLKSGDRVANRGLEGSPLYRGSARAGMPAAGPPVPERR